MTAEIEKLLADFLERRERGEDVDAEALAREHPERRDEILAALAGLERAEARLDAIAGVAPGRIGPYSITGEIARGGMGRVLEAVDARDPGRRVALKLLDAASALGARARERFEREAAILAGLEHPGVVRVLGAGLEGPTPWIAMERVEGETLATLLGRARSAERSGSAPTRPFTPAQAAQIAAHLARAVEAVHRTGVLHRDIKPANVILTPQGRVVLVDFGLVHDESAATLTNTGDLLGTPQYMAPEQARGLRADERTDVYGIAAILHELLTLEAPHGSGDALALLERIRKRAVRPLRRRSPEIPRELERIVLRALAFRRARRTPTAAALAIDLEAHLEGRPVAARAPSVVEKIENFARNHGARAPLLGVIAFGLLGAWMLAQRATDRFETRREELVAAVLSDWLDEDGEGARRSAELLLDHAPRCSFGPLLRALARDEDMAPGEDEVEATAARGWNAIRAGRHAEAIEELQRAKALAPRSLVPVLLLARAADRARDLDLAAREYRAAVELVPASAAVHARLANVHYARDDYAEAESAIRTAIALDPAEGSHEFALARILYRHEQHAEGLAAALRGAELEGDAASTTELQILAAGLDQDGRHEEARAVLQRVLEQKPGDPRTLYNLAYSYSLDHHLREARDAYLRIQSGSQVSAGLVSAAWLVAGSNAAECEQCDEYYERDPDLLDFTAAEELALQALRRNDSDEVPALAARVAILIESPDAIRAALEELQAAETDDRRIGLLERALRSLPAR